MTPELIAGVLAGVAGLLVFLTIHHFWIEPIWFILPAGLVIAALGGLAVGWSYAEIRVGLPPRPWMTVSIVLLIAAVLTPAVVLAQLRAPLLLDMRSGIPPGEGGRVLAHFTVELLVTATVVGALAGWWLGHSERAIIATALAGLVFALGPGHNIPLLGGTPAVGKGLVLLVAITLVSAVVLVETSAWLAQDANPR